MADSLGVPRIYEIHKVAERKYHHYDIDLMDWLARKPFGLSGYFRLKNEAEFMVPAIMSHLPWLDEAVLVVQPSNDNTEKIAIEMARTFPEKIKVHIYPFDIHPPMTPEHFTEPENSIRHFVYLSNWGLSKCNYSWIAKTEGDVIALSTFARIRQAIEHNPEKIAYYGRLGLNIAGKNKDQISYPNPRNAGWDEAVFNNNPHQWYFERYDKWESINMNDHREAMINMGFSFLHTKRCKAQIVRLHTKWCKAQIVRLHNERWADPAKEEWVSFTRENTRNALLKYNITHKPPHPDICPDVLFERTLVTHER